jgi:carboxyl-terminal processing protease
VNRRAVLAPALALGLFAASGLPLAAQAPQALETFDAVWTIVRDTHFDKTLNGVDWPAVRTELRPRAAAAKTPGELRAVLREMLGRLGQSHFTIIPATADSPASAAGDLGGDPGLDVRLVGRDLLVTRVDPDSGAAAAGVRPGWKITGIDGRSSESLLRGLPEDANDRVLHVEAWRIVEMRLRGPEGAAANIMFEDGDGKALQLSVDRRPEPGQPVTVGNLPTMFVRTNWEKKTTAGGASAGVIRFNVWMTAVDRLFQKAIDELRESDGIVIDLRGNPGGLAGMMMGISGHFLGERKSLGVMKTRDNKLEFMSNPRLVNGAGERVEPFAGPVAILVDAMSGSTSECFAGGMQSLGRARVFGQVSMGQALPALFDRLPNGDVLLHAYGDFVTSNGTRLEGRGVIPDEIVPLKRAELLSGRDAPLEAALVWIEKSRVATTSSKGSAR